MGDGMRPDERAIRLETTVAIAPNRTETAMLGADAGVTERQRRTQLRCKSDAVQ